MFSATSLIQAGGPLNLSLVPRDLMTQQSKDDAKGQSTKVSGLEAMLRKEIQKKHQEVNAPTSTQHTTSRHEAVRSKLKWENDSLYKRYDNHLGNFNMQTQQIRSANDEAEKALEVSTLESKRALGKIENSNNNLSMLASQRGLFAASNRQEKRMRKPEYSKWANTFLL
jgi:hypothetical protein